MDVAAADPEYSEAGPERTCIVTRRVAAPDGMLRFVLGPDGTVVPDLRRKLPGRGVWVTLSAKTLAEAVKKKAFARGLKAAARIPETLVADVDRLLERDALQALSLANKAGLVLTGAAKVETAIGRGEVRALIHAADGGPDGARKLIQAVTRRNGDPHAVPVIEDFASSQLDLALGRTNVIHAALVAGPASEGFIARCDRLATYRQDRDVRHSGENTCPPEPPIGDATVGVRDE
jgi:predicted RNA-binding protein YlxR (DUF448 family)